MRKKILLPLALMVCLVFYLSSAIGQESTFLSQKLMLEKDLHSRIENALSKILDDQRYVLDVTVDLKFTPTIKEEVTFRPGTERPSGIEPEADPPKESVSTVDDKTSRITGLPIPGFEFGRYDEDEPAAEVPVDSPPTATSSPTSGESNIVTQSYTDIKSSLPKVERMEIGCILPEGSAPELIENVRQIIMVASKFDRSRGDVLSIMTASFKERKDEKTAETVILRTIAHKIDSLESIQSTDKSVESDMLMEEWLRWQEEERSRREEEVGLLSSELAVLKDQLLQKEEETKAAEQAAEQDLQQARMDEYANQIAALQIRLDSLQILASQDQEESEETAMQPKGLSTAPQEESSGGKDNLPIYLMSAISLLAVIALAAVIIFNGRSKPKYVMPPPWMMPPPKKKKVKKTKKSKKDDKGQKDASEPPVTPVQQPQPQTQPEPAVETEEDTAVMQSEIRSARQSVVSM
ncbi:MAG: flagellar M-ring protein FliF C-terminal domain-containing protein, partial [Candidatus Marinimicrobia bacterium]|nr:flagellar M-ring protein FliF C-terminal domain-containing protein [Candidatus Neomarinimicrobiota bacterium]